MKFKLMKEYVQNLPDDDIVCFVDGYDVIILEPVDKLEKLFRETGKKKFQEILRMNVYCLFLVHI